MKKWLDRYDNGGQAPARDNTTVYRNVLPISMPQPKPAYINPTPDYKDSEWYKQESEDFKTRRNITQPVLHAADVATDVMQLGNFIPLPQAQAVGKLGNFLGPMIDSYQAVDAFKNKDYVNAGINTLSALLPAIINNPNVLGGYRRSAKYNFGNRSFYNPIDRRYGRMTEKQLLANRMLLGTLGAETTYDTYAEGGTTMLLPYVARMVGSLLNSGDNPFERGASFLEYQNKMNNATPVSLNPRVAKQNDIVKTSASNNKNYAIVDKKADSIFYFTPEGKNITGEPVITEASRNDIDRGLSMKEWSKETGDNNHEHYFQYLKDNNLQTTPAGIFHINDLRINTAQDPFKPGKFYNDVFRPDKAQQIYESRIKDYGPRQLMFTFTDENGKESSKAIHGTAREERLNAFNNLEKDRGLSNGCINVNGKTICFNALEAGSNLYVLPEQVEGYLYPKKKMDISTLNPLKKYYKKDGGQIHNWREVEVPHTKNQLSGWLDKL